MSVTQISSGQKNWLSVLNTNFTELSNRDSGSWTASGITALNGYKNNDCYYFNGKIGGQQFLIIAGNVSISNGSIASQTNRPVLQFPTTINGFGRLVTAYSYAQNSNHVPLKVTYSPSTKQVVLANVGGDTSTFTSIDFSIILTN